MPAPRGHMATCGLLPRGGMRNMPERMSRQTDVVIVGSGAVGIAAGLEAHEAGAQVIVIEKEAQLGGAAAISGGAVAASARGCSASMVSKTHRTWPLMTGLHAVRVRQTR